MFPDPRTDQYSDIEPFAQCPCCNRLIKLNSLTDAVLNGARTCPGCLSTISRKEVISSYQRYLKTTRAIQSVGHILSAYRVLPVVFGMVSVETTFICFSESGKFNFLFYLTLFISVLILAGGLLNVQNWLSNFGKIPTADEEFLLVRKKVRRAQVVWVWANILNAVWWLVYIKFL